jgi:hypothetical protein
MDLRVEARGRFEGKLGGAKAEVRKKFGSNTSFARQLGVIFSPRTSLIGSFPDIILLDPESDGMPDESAHREYRSLLLHYVHFFSRQNFDDFACRLTTLAQASDEDFEGYLQNGDDDLRRARVKRTAFHLENEEFVGTAWGGVAWPAGLGGGAGLDVDFSAGCFYWGIWTKVLSALREGQLQDIVNMDAREETYVDRLRVYIVLDDATALAWAPTEEELLAMP